MAFEDLLDHRCAIYHMVRADAGIGYGIKAKAFSYPDVPDIEEAPCHFNVNGSANMQQTDDANEYTVVGKLQLPAGTDVWANDKIVDLGSGLSYTAELPKDIRGHHMTVAIQRKGKVRGAV